MPTDVFPPELTQELEQELLALNPEAHLRQRIRTVHEAGDADLVKGPCIPPPVASRSARRARHQTARGCA